MRKRVGELGYIEKSLTKGQGMKPLYEIDFIRKGTMQTLGGKGYSRPPSQIKTKSDLPQQYLLLAENKGKSPLDLGIGKTPKQTGLKVLPIPKYELLSKPVTQSEPNLMPIVSRPQPKGFRSERMRQRYYDRYKLMQEQRAAQIQSQLPVLTNQNWDV